LITARPSFARFFPASPSETDGVQFAVGNLAAWLTGVLADAGHKKLTE
jgi:hypothetical protein